MPRETLETQINRSTAKRVAFAAGVIATIIGITKRREIMSQVTRAINRLPDLYEGLKTGSQNAWLQIVRTESPEEAEKVFSKLMDSGRRGTQRLQLDPKLVDFMSGEHMFISSAEAAKATIPSLFVVQSMEEDTRIPIDRRRFEIFVRLTSRRFDTLTKQNP